MSNNSPLVFHSLQKRFPSRRDLVFLFLVCVFITHVWSMINFLHEMPSYILQQTIGEIIGVFSYMQMFVLIETLLVFGVILLIAFILPGKVILAKFISQGSLLIIITSLWTIPIHFQDQIISKLSLEIRGYLILVSLWIFSYIAVLFGSSILFRRVSKFEAAIQSFINKVVILSIIYLSLDIACGVVVASRIIIQVPR